MGFSGCVLRNLNQEGTMTTEGVPVMHRYLLRYRCLLAFSRPIKLLIYYIVVSRNSFTILFIYLFGVLRRFQHCIGHITMGSWKGRGNQYIQLVKVLYCKLPTNGKQLPAFPLEAMPGTGPRPQRLEAKVLPLCHRGPNSFTRN